jgi:hypothetical protein
MRLKSYITEVKDLSYEEIRTILERDCKEILQFYRYGRLLYRGIRTNDSDPIFVTKTPRDDRRPKDTSEYIHDYMNKLYKKKFGWEVRNGISVSNSFAQADAYGNVHVFFPVDGFKYVWHPDIYDFTNDFAGEHMSDWNSDPTDDLDFQIAAQQLVDTSYDKNIKGAYGYHREIMFWAPKYYLLRNIYYEDVFPK